ncbi:uncharacterized protein TM35_000172410 [Trypanosoma theileri]|uniref:Uncharacterized protein n=1 Tax=Trypanosoma theileri TaxID=67003 RepID=A0A1X0NVY2_9TRYP|nr:uncharacterized protein TM35_000172410 [Trypanosoma theileri]ORC88369.1 hypothetical protein TM35_000172410 [Trypanosoma theileri]
MPPTFRRRVVVSKAVQTEASFPPDCQDTTAHVEELASEQFHDLCKLRDVIRDAMKEVACSVYDVVSFKDVLFKMEEELPSTLPVTDMLLISSKLFRRTAELGRLLACFFAVTFAEQHADEDFHFTELRVLRRELIEVRKECAKAVEDRDRLQRMLDDVGRVAMNHSRAVDLLETRNTALQLQTSGLEDQMALLFSQLNKDLHRQCKDAYERVTTEIENQDRMNVTKATFRQTMDSLSDQLRHSRTLINDVRELVISCAQGATATGRGADAQISKEPSIRFKLKQVENNFQQLISRFSSVKGIVAETAQELMNALHERKNILYLSLQHIRLYDIQNSKMRRGKAVVVDMKRVMDELRKRLGVTFPPGAVTFVDRIGRISTQQYQVGQTLATLRNQKTSENPDDDSVVTGGPPSLPSASPVTQMPPLLGPQRTSADYESPINEQSGYFHMDTTSRDSLTGNKIPFQTVYNVVDMVKALERSMEGLDETLNFENEINAFLKTLTLSLSTTPREVDETFGEFLDPDKSVEKALLPTGDASLKQSTTTSVSTARRGTHEIEGANSSILSAISHTDRGHSTDDKVHAAVVEQEQRVKKLQDQLNSVRPEFAAKISFLRQVYEARICDLEVKEANFQRRIGGVGGAGGGGGGGGSLHKEGKEKDGKKRTGGRSEFDVSSSPSPETMEMEKRRKKDDRDQLIQYRTEWQQTKPILQGNKKTREAALNEISRMARGMNPGEKTDRSERAQSSRSRRSSRSPASSTSRRL